MWKINGEFYQLGCAIKLDQAKLKMMKKFEYKTNKKDMIDYKIDELKVSHEDLNYRVSMNHNLIERNNLIEERMKNGDELIEKIKNKIGMNEDKVQRIFEDENSFTSFIHSANVEI